ncbi:MAG: hypothetical protein WBG92_11140 [Thiohalocapsa sp.]
MLSRNRATRLIVFILLVIVPATSAWATTRQEAEAAIAEAKAQHEKATTTGASDSQAAQMIEEATALLSTRQYTKSKMIAYWAIRQTEYELQVQSGETVIEEDKAAMAESLIAAAEEARAKAASVGGEWRDTASMIKSAQTLAGAGEFDKAIEAASAAKFQAQRGYEQAMDEKDADFPDYMRKASEQ